jgi:hypothetical protein
VFGADDGIATIAFKLFGVRWYGQSTKKKYQHKKDGQVSR